MYMTNRPGTIGLLPYDSPQKRQIAMTCLQVIQPLLRKFKRLAESLPPTAWVS
jgi:hypothetical protein